MMRPGIMGERLVSLFLLGALVLNPPFLAIFNVQEYVLGIPTLYAYLFGVWAALIVLTALTIESALEDEGDGAHEHPPSEGGPDD